MSRADYDDDIDQWELIRWRGAVASAIRGARGQAFLRELLAAMDTLPRRRLIHGKFYADGEVCALGAVAVCRAMDMEGLDPDDHENVGPAFGVAGALAREVMYLNDIYSRETPEDRFERMRAWVVDQIRSEKMEAP